METDTDYGAVIYFRNGMHEHYRIDLDCLPETLCPIANFTLELESGWTVIDECIYCIGGRKREKGNIHFTVGMKLNKYNTADPNSTWELILPNRNLRWHRPFVFAFGRKIYVISGNKLNYDYECEEENADWTYLGEYYNLDSQTWSCLPKLTHSLSGFKTAVVDKTKIVFYSVYADVLLFYDVDKEEIHTEHHPNFVLAHPNLLLPHMVVRCGLERSAFRYALFHTACHTEAVVCHSTLYWFNTDLCLYGYDYVKMRWFQSNSLEGELAWPISGSPDDFLYRPLLFCLDNETFVAIVRVNLKELGMAIIGVKREPLFLHVSLKFSQNFLVDTSNFDINPSRGMAIRKDQGLENKNIHRRTNG